VKAERILNKTLTKQQRDRLARLTQKADSEIDVSDVPPLTDQQLAEMQQWHWLALKKDRCENDRGSTAPLPSRL
jgi:hypothetical protein